jgi:hypothetical protein
MVKAKNGGQYQKQYFLCILAYGVEVKQKSSFKLLYRSDFRFTLRRESESQTQHVLDSQRERERKSKHRTGMCINRVVQKKTTHTGLVSGRRSRR